MGEWERGCEDEGGADAVVCLRHSVQSRCDDEDLDGGWVAGGLASELNHEYGLNSGPRAETRSKHFVTSFSWKVPYSNVPVQLHLSFACIALLSRPSVHRARSNMARISRMGFLAIAVIFHVVSKTLQQCAGAGTETNIMHRCISSAYSTSTLSVP